MFAEKELILRKNEILETSSDYIYRVVEGVLKSYTWDYEGRIAPLSLWGEGNLIVNKNSIAPLVIEAIEPSRVLKIPQQKLQENININGLLTSLERHQKLLKILRTNPNSFRVLEFFKWLSEEFGENETLYIRLTIKLTHQEIAEFLNTTRVTVTRSISELVKDGAITNNRRVIRVNKKFL